MSYAVIFEKNGEIVALRPDEIADDNIISCEKNAKDTATVYIYPAFEAWGFCEKDLTYATIIDLDSGTIEMYGRVAELRDSMDSSGRYRQEVTIGGALDFLDESFVRGLTAYDSTLGRVLTAQEITDLILSAHNAEVGSDTRRQFRRGNVPNVPLVGGSADWVSALQALKTFFVEKMGYELRVRHEGGVNYIDIAESFGEHKDTAIKIGDNLKEITAERSAANRLITRLYPLSGRGADGNTTDIRSAIMDNPRIYGADNPTYYGLRYIDNAALVQQYGVRAAVVRNNDIYNRYPGGHDAASWHDYQIGLEEASTQLYDWAVEQAAKLGETPVKITLSASDLSKIGFTDYDSLELGNVYPVIAPKFAIYKDMKITALKRRMAQRQIVEITIKSGEELALEAGTLSQQIARAQATTAQSIDRESERTSDILTATIDQTTDGVRIEQINKDDFDALTDKPDNVMYIVDDDGTRDLYIGDKHISSGGGGGGTIQNAVVLTTEQNSSWAPAHELVPVEFRGNANVFYGQAPARFVCQSQRVLFNTVPDYAEDISTQINWEFFDGHRERLVADIYAMHINTGWNTSTQYLFINPRVLIYDTSGASEVYKGSIIGVANPSSRFELAQIPLTYSTIKIGIETQCTEFATYNNVLCTKVQHYLVVMVDGARVWRTAMSSSDYYSTTGQDAYRCRPWSTDAEREFAIGISQRTEPIYPEDNP